MKLLIASNNKHKIEEIKKALANKFEEITSIEEEGIVCDPEENGKTFYENALIKAQTVAQFTDKAVLADDTGLCVDALDGRPGVHSARYADDHDSAANRRKVLAELAHEPNRSAHFETVVVLLFPDGKTIYGKGRIDGYILDKETGSNGFGYDSVFFSTELGKTFAQATIDEKLLVSHRSRALADLLAKL